jgi:hypothetical protein
MSKELIIFARPELDSDSNGQANFVVGAGHSIPYAHCDRAEAPVSPRPASIKLI